MYLYTPGWSGTCYVNQADLKLRDPLPLPPKGLDERLESPCLVNKILNIWKSFCLCGLY